MWGTLILLAGEQVPSLNRPKEDIMSNCEWTEPACSGPVLVADVVEDVTAELYIDYQDGVQVTLLVCGAGVRGRMGRCASTDYTEDWPEVERFIPRSEWPKEIYGGRRGSGERTPDEAVAKAVAEAVKEWEEAEADVEAYEARWEAMIDAKLAVDKPAAWQSPSLTGVLSRPVRAW